MAPCTLACPTSAPKTVSVLQYYFVASFIHPLPWAVENCAATDLACNADPERSLPIPAADAYLLNKVMRYDEESVANATAKVISGPLFGGATFTSDGVPETQRNVAD
jgi:hypothetical protein